MTRAHFKQSKVVNVNAYLQIPSWPCFSISQPTWAHAFFLENLLMGLLCVRQGVEVTLSKGAESNPPPLACGQICRQTHSGSYQICRRQLVLDSIYCLLALPDPQSRKPEETRTRKRL